MKLKLIVLGVLYVIALILMAVAYSSCSVYKYSYDGEEYRTERQVRKAMREKAKCMMDSAECHYGKSTMKLKQGNLVGSEASNDTAGVYLRLSNAILDELDSMEKATIRMKLND